MTAPPSNFAPRAQTVERLAGELGFALLGIAPASPGEHAEFFRQWLAAGKHGEMDYLTQSLQERLDPARLVPGARSIICVADRYPSSPTDGEGDARDQAPRLKGRVARYAWGDDYHRLMKKRLHNLADALRQQWPEHEYRSAVDTAPVLEREHALHAGLGWIGKHTLLIHPQLGSWLLLGEIITTLPLQTSAEAGQPMTTDHCGTCTRCIDACPTHCISPYQLDASRCISYLTLEHRGPIDPALHQAMGPWIAGCDVCQEVCPFNAKDAVTSTEIHPAYRTRPPAPSINLLEVLSWTAADRRSAFERSSLKRLRLAQLKRNALIAAGNYLASAGPGDTDAAALRGRIDQIAADESEEPLVRQTAKEVTTSAGGLR